MVGQTGSKSTGTKSVVFLLYGCDNDEQARLRHENCSVYVISLIWYALVFVLIRVCCAIVFIWYIVMCLLCLLCCAIVCIMHREMRFTPDNTPLTPVCFTQSDYKAVGYPTIL